MLDDRDARILALLQADADQPISALAEAVHLSTSACARRIARLREEGYIEKQVALLNRRKMRVPTTVFVVIKTAHHSADWVESFRRAVADIPEIVEVHRLTGNFDYILKIVLPDVEHYDVVYKRLVGKIELFDVSAYISMETVKQGSAVPTTYA